MSDHIELILNCPQVIEADDDDLETRRETAAISFDKVTEVVTKYLCKLAQVGIVSMDNKTISSQTCVEPSTYEEAWNHPDPIQRRKWRAAITKEFGNMNKQVVWTLGY